MPWARLHDGMTFHPKVINAGNEAVGIWARMLAHCNFYLTDGVIPEDVARGLVRRYETHRGPLRKLAESGLVTRQENGSWLIHDYLDWNDSKAEILKKRAIDAERKRLSRGCVSARTSGGQKTGVQTSTPTTTPTTIDDDEIVKIEEFGNTISDAGIAISLTNIDRKRFSLLYPVEGWELVDAIAKIGDKRVNSAGYVLSIMENQRQAMDDLKNKPKPPGASKKPQPERAAAWQETNLDEL